MIIAATTESPENSLAGFLLSVYKRETLGSTYLKGGIAITIKAGAKFILSPVMLTKEIIDLCKQYSVISVSGAMSPTEIYKSFKDGVSNTVRVRMNRFGFRC